MAGPEVRARVVRPPPGAGYSAVLPARPAAGRWTLGGAASALFHALLIFLLLRHSSRQSSARAEAAPTQIVNPIQISFAPPRPQETPRPSQPELTEAVPLTPGNDETPGSPALVTPDPEQNPNAPPGAVREEAFRPDPSNDGEQDRGDEATAPMSASPAPSRETTGEPTLESEARRLFGRPSSRLGPTAGTRDNRPWESASISPSDGCNLPPEELSDSTLPKGMAAVAGRIYREDNGRPLPGARLQILGTPYGTFANDRGEYRLVFDRALVDRCRTQAVRVSAPGYQGRDVILFVGSTPNGDVPLRRF